MTGSWRHLCLGVVMATLVAMTALRGAAQQLPLPEVRGDAIATPLTAEPGDAVRGQKLALDREIGNCLICHEVPGTRERFQGNLGPSLAGVGARLSVAQLRLRLVDQSRLNPATIMPPYYKTDGLLRVASRYAGKPVLDAQQIEDVVAYLATLRD